MNKFLIVLLLSLCMIPVVSRADDSNAETMTLSSASAVTSANKYSGRQIAIQCDGEVRYKMCVDSSCTAGGAADSTSARLTNFDLPVDLCVPVNKIYLSLIRTGSSTVTCYVYRVDPKTICK
jgi:hypothetical protein